MSRLALPSPCLARLTHLGPRAVSRRVRRAAVDRGKLIINHISITPSFTPSVHIFRSHLQTLEVQWRGPSTRIDAVHVSLQLQRRMNLHDLREHEAVIKMLRVYNAVPSAVPAGAAPPQVKNVTSR